MIAEILFLSDGFKDARILSTKIVELLKLASEQLSNQDQYDWGMRALKNTVTLSGDLKRLQPFYKEIQLVA